jgi:group I intron endonuclease
MVGIYKITSPTGKVYIGQSWNIENRWKGHKKRCHKGLLSNSFKSHGVDNHKFEIVHLLPNDVEQDVLDNYEQLYMDAYKDCGITLLNIREGGSKGKLAESTKIKLAKYKIGIPPTNKGVKGLFTHSEEERQRISKRFKGIKRSEDFCLKMSLRQIGEKNHMYGKHHTDEWKEKIRKKVKGKKLKPHTQEAKDKMREHALNREKIKCDYCEAIVTPGMLKRWHNDKCKHKK